MCVCTRTLCVWPSVRAYLFVYEQDVWHSGYTHAGAAVIQFIVPLRVSALIARVCRCGCVCVCTGVHDGFSYQFMGDYMDSFHSYFSL